MPAPTVVADLLECVRKSGVVEPKRLEDYVARLGQDAPATPAQMADALVRDGLLTRFQSDQIVRGRWRNFILCGKYTILEPLGAGGMGAVYLCSHNIMRRPVAIKVLPTAQAEEAGAVERFHREAEAVAKLRHPNIVGAYDVDRDGKFHFLVMEYVDGVNLQDLVKRGGPLDPVRAAHYVHQAALGLEHAHQAGLVHRDIKPANLLVDRTGVVKILDLGLARFFRDTRESVTQKYDTNAVLGTADYLAPEQAVDSHNVDIRCDIYSLGNTFYFLLAGRTPFQDGDVAEKLIWHQVRKPTPIRELRPETPQGLADVLEKMIAKEPAQRYQTPAELAQALAPFTRTPIDPPSAEELPPITPGARLAGVSDSNNVLPRLPSPSTPTPSPVRTAWPGARAASPAPAQEEMNTRKDGRTALLPSGPVTMMSAPAPEPAGTAAIPVASELILGPARQHPRRFPRRLAALVAVAVLALALAGLGIAVGLGFFRPTNSQTNPPNNGTQPPATAVSIVRGDDGVRVKTAKYEALIAPDGCLTSLTAGGVEFLRPGEPLGQAKVIARGCYFYYMKSSHQGVVQMPKIELGPGANVVKASGDGFSVAYEFTPEAVHIQPANGVDEVVPFYMLLNPASITDVVNGAGERLTVPAGGKPDPKWATTTWKAGRAVLKITRTDAGETLLWGPFGLARAQVWGAQTASHKTADIRLEPSVLTEDEKPPAAVGGVLITRQGDGRRIRTDRYETVVDADGCVAALSVDGVDFFKHDGDPIRGAYFFQSGKIQPLPNIGQGEPSALMAWGDTAAMHLAFGPDLLTWSMENKTDAPMSFYILLDPAVIAVRNARDDWLKPPFGNGIEGPDPKWAKATLYAGRPKITITGGSKMWGPWEQKYQVWEAYLAAKEKRQIVLETALAAPDEAKKAAATAGTDPPKGP